jgi:hypothetical protein
MIDQVAKDIIAAEKLRVLERREATRGIAERNVRVPLRWWGRDVYYCCKLLLNKSMDEGLRGSQPSFLGFFLVLFHDGCADEETDEGEAKDENESGDADGPFAWGEEGVYVAGWIEEGLWGMSDGSGRDGREECRPGKGPRRSSRRRRRRRWGALRRRWACRRPGEKRGERERWRGREKETIVVVGVVVKY